MRGLTDKVVIVTGGAGGIGRAVCRRFAQEGAQVAIFDLDGQAADETARELVESGSTATAMPVDVSDHAAVEQAVAKTVSSLGPVDVLVNNAGWDVFRPFLETEPALWDRLIAINLRGPINLHHVVLPGMVQRGTGRIVNVSSDAARVGSSGEAVYSACKAGLIALSKTLAREHARHGITFNVVCPGPTKTPLLEGFLAGAANPQKLAAAFARAAPMGRLGEPEDVPGLVAFLASDDAAFITGQVVSVSGGLTMSG